MNRHKQRENAMTCIYQSLLLKSDLDEIVMDVLGTPRKKLDAFYEITIYKAIENKDRYAKYINDILTDWTFDRLGYVERAILLVACAELEYQTAEIPVIIDEAIRLTKDYCDDQAYKLINSVLDRL